MPGRKVLYNTDLFFEQERQQSNEWFDNFMTMVRDMGLDTNNPVTVSRFFGFSVRRDVNDMTRYELRKRPVLMELEHDFNIKVFKDNLVSLEDLEDEEKYEFYKLAKSGRLVLSGDDGDVQKERLIYLGTDGLPHITKPANEIPLTEELENGVKQNPESGIKLKQVSNTFSNEQNNEAVLHNIDAMQPVYEEKYKPFAPDRENGANMIFDFMELLNAQYLEHAMDVGIDYDSPEGKVNARRAVEENVKKGWEAEILADMKVHPDFYSNEVYASMRSKHFLDNLRADFGEDIPEWKSLKEEVKKHPVNYYCDTENALKQTGLSLDQLLADSLIGTGDGNTYTQGSYPWDTIDAINNDVLNDKDVYVYCKNKETGKLEPHLLSLGFTNTEIKLSKNPVNLLPQMTKQGIMNDLNQLVAELNETGETRRDSAQFRAFKAQCVEGLKSIGNTLQKEKIEAELDGIKRAAKAYYDAKACEKHNSRRSKRFNLARMTMNMGKKLTPEQLVKADIAYKAVKAQALIMSKSENEAVSNEAHILLGNPDAISQKAEELMNTDAFGITFNNISLKDLKKVFANSPEMLASVCNFAQPKNDIEAPVIENPNNNNAQVKQDQPNGLHV